MPEELAKQTDSSGRLRFIAGSPAIHVISTAFVARLTEGGTLRLPWHRADKKVPYVNAVGETVTPDDVNAVKLESFIFDALPLAEKTMVLEAARDEEFAPTKNKTGVDSVESCRDMLVERDARRLERAGLKVPRGADGKPSVKVELSPRLFLDDEDVAAYLREHSVSTTGSELYIG
jgi:UDP-N-acetylglucosamine/UDP-N-acetylgalactosamine diphosphorylase